MLALAWPAVAERLLPPLNYWVGTTGRDGAPHASPVWGVVVDATLYFYTVPRTIKARNLQADPRLVVHLDSADDVLIVHGAAEAITDPSLLGRVIAAFSAKYTAPDDLQYLPTGPPAELIFAVRPAAALAWSLGAYETSQQRWAAPD